MGFFRSIWRLLTELLGLVNEGMGALAESARDVRRAAEFMALEAELSRLKSEKKVLNAIEASEGEAQADALREIIANNVTVRTNQQSMLDVYDQLILGSEPPERNKWIAEKTAYESGLDEPIK